MTNDIPIRADFPEEDDLVLRLALGACRLVVTRGEGTPWVEGTYTDPSGDIPVRIDAEGGRLTIGQERSFAAAVGLFRGRPTCELRLGSGKPFRLQVETGASEVELQLGGVPLRGLDVKAGAGKLEVNVDRPNPTEADEVSLRIGAGGLETSGLGNLAAERLRADGGAASLALDLTGELRRPMDVTASAGMSGVRITVPGDRPVRVTTSATLGDTDLGDGFVTRDGAVHTLAEGEPVLTVHATVALGSLQLRSATA